MRPARTPGDAGTKGARPGESLRPGPLASAPAVLLIGYAADTDLGAVSAALDTVGIPNLLWLYDAHADDLTVDARPGHFRLEHRDSVLTAEHFARARVVVHRTGLGRWRRPVSAPNAAETERDFTEREWASLLQGLFFEAERRYAHLTWLNPPSISAVSGAKYDLLASADLDGLDVPDLRVSTEGRLPGSGSGPYVCKAIGEDERIDEASTYCTSVLDLATLNELPYRTTCPSLIQERVLAEYELRVYYLLARRSRSEFGPAPATTRISVCCGGASGPRRSRPSPRGCGARCGRTAGGGASPTACSTSCGRRTGATC